jgi:hypothetical protein
MYNIQPEDSHMMMFNDSSTRRNKTFFTVASLGKNRWYWVVWPSLELLQSQGLIHHLADGYEKTKADAVEQALEVAGTNTERVAAKYAKRYHRHRMWERMSAKHGEPDRSNSLPDKVEFLYRDVRDEEAQKWYSVPHRVIKKTKEFTYVERGAYDAARLTGYWLDHDIPAYRLSRKMLAQEGYAYVPVTAEVDDPLFFTTPYQDRVARYRDLSFDCLSILRLSFPCTLGEVRAAYRRLVKRAHPDRGGSHEEFLALRDAYDQALLLCRYQT